MQDKIPNINEKATKKCAVKNCQNQISEGEGNKIGGKLYCRKCATQIIKQSFAPN